MTFILLILSLTSSYAQIALDEVIEDSKWYLPIVSTQTSPAIINKNEYIEITAVGDTAWTYGARPSDGSQTPKEATFDQILNDLDPQKNLFVGDLSFVNWESAVGEFCDAIRPTVSFYFLTHPDSVEQAIEHGFNLIGLANNHSQDCDLGRAFKNSSQSLHGPLMSAEALSELKGEFLWHGVGENPFSIKIKEMMIKGKKIKIAFASLALISWDIPNSSFINFRTDYEQKLEIFFDGFNIVADLKILAIHTQDKSGHQKPEDEAYLLMKKIGEKFINKYGGDIVFGQGAHTYGGVKVIEANKKKSVFVTSLGNFIHDGLRANPDNYIAKILLSTDDLKLKQIQILPFINNAGSERVKFYDGDCSRIDNLKSNFVLRKTSIQDKCHYFSSF